MYAIVIFTWRWPECSPIRLKHSLTLPETTQTTLQTLQFPFTPPCAKFGRWLIYVNPLSQLRKWCNEAERDSNIIPPSTFQNSAKLKMTVGARVHKKFSLMGHEIMCHRKCHVLQKPIISRGKKKKNMPLLYGITFLLLSF